MLYKNLPKAVGLRRVTLHKSLNPNDGKDTVYLLLVECSHFMDHVGEAANLLPILRGRICGYTGIYRVADSFWQKPSHAGRENLETINHPNIGCVSNYTLQSSFHLDPQKGTLSAKTDSPSNISPASPNSLPENPFPTIEEESAAIPKSQSTSIAESSSGRGFFASLFNLW